MERTLVLIKPDAVQRRLIGDIIDRFEKASLKLIAAKMVRPDLELAQKHYPADRREFIEGMGNKTLGSYKAGGLDPLAEFGTDDPHTIGLKVHKWLSDFLVSGPVIAIVLEGEGAVGKVREIAGHTIPAMADSGTIRGDYSDDTPIKANAEKRAIKNLVHASGDKQEAEFEINLWFSSEELHAYDVVE